VILKVKNRLKLKLYHIKLQQKVVINLRKTRSTGRNYIKEAVEKMKANLKIFTPFLALLATLFFASNASAELLTDGVLDQVVLRFAERSKLWADTLQSAALWLFWTLGAISMVWTFGLMALRKADIQEFFSEFIKFIMFFGFFLWLLQNGPEFATSIIESMVQLGAKATNSSIVTPSAIIDIGFAVWSQAIKNLSGWSPVDSIAGLALSAGILIMLAIVAINMMLLMISAWFLMYAGIFFLGFGGSKWTSDMAINYYKTVLGMGAQILTMVLLLAIGNDLLGEYYSKMNTGRINFEELAVMIVFCLALLMLTNSLPSLIAGIITGSSVGSQGIGNFGAGAAVGAAMTAAGMAAGGAAMAGQAIMGATTGAAGVGSAISAAMQAAQGGGSDAGLGSIAGSGSSEAGTAGDTPFAQAAGLDTVGSSGSDGGAGSDGGSGSSGSDGGSADTGGGSGSSGSDGGSGSPKSKLALAAATAGKLGQGIKSMAVESAKEKISKTAGGKLAERIKNPKPKKDE
jgi:type IV secretion system protein TrbL